MAANYTKIQTTLAQELLITRLLTAVLESAGQTGATKYFRSIITIANAYDKTLTEDNRAIGFDTTHYDTSMMPNIRALIRNYRSIIQNQGGWAGVLAREINMSDADKGVLAGAQYRYENTNLGEIHVTDRQGPFGALYRQMVIDGQYVVSNSVTFGSLTAEGTTRGVLDSASVVANNFLSNCHTGVLRFKCINESVTVPQMSVALTIAPNSNTGALPVGLPDGTTIINAENSLTINKAFDDLRLGISGLTLTRTDLATPVITGDNVSTPLFSSVTVVTPYDGDCYKGQFYLRVTRQAVSPIWLIEFFSDSGLTNKVGGITSDTAIGTTALSKTLNSGSVVAFTFSNVNANTVLPTSNATTSITVDIKTPRNGDSWTMAITNQYLAQCSTLLAKLWPIALPAVPVKPGAPTAALAGLGAGNVNNGTHSYKVTLVGPGGESPAGTGSNVVTTSGGNGQVALTAVPVGAANTGITSRNIYRTVAGDAGNYKLVGSIANNSATIFADNVADGSLGAAAPTYTQWDDSLFTAFSIS